MQTALLLRGERLSLRFPEKEDATLLYRWEQDESAVEAGDSVATLAEINTYLETCMNDLHAEGQLRLIMQDHFGASIGCIDLFDYSERHLRAGIGIITERDYRRKGFAREALEILIRYSFETLHLHQLHALVPESNKASLHLFRSGGFVECGRKKDWLKKGAGFVDAIELQLINKGI